ncbi:S24 family peptidase [Grimontia kaedaensis]|nr:helix-turn-helix transcriptional regulator [Grimontia kaedaensis]
MSTLANKIKERMHALDINQRELSERIGISQVAVHKLVSGKTKQTSKINELATALECDPAWLGNNDDVGDMGEAQWRGVETWDSHTPLSDEEIELPFYTSIELSAGSGSFTDTENTGPKLRFSKATLRRLGIEKANAVCVNVSGNSMEPVLPDKATVGIDTGDKTRIVDGAIYAINHGGLLRVKVLQNLPGGGIRLKSYNSDDYPAEDYSAAEKQDIEIIGRVFWYSVLLPR